jgi:lysozyme family protein
MGQPPLRNFRDSRWRYSQFVVLGLAVAGLVKWLSPLGWAAALGVGALAGIGLWLVEKRRGVI